MEKACEALIDQLSRGDEGHEEEEGAVKLSTKEVLHFVHSLPHILPLQQWTSPSLMRR